MQVKERQQVETIDLAPALPPKRKVKQTGMGSLLTMGGAALGLAALLMPQETRAPEPPKRDELEPFEPEARMPTCMWNRLSELVQPSGAYKPVGKRQFIGDDGSELPTVYMGYWPTGEVVYHLEGWGACYCLPEFLRWLYATARPEHVALANILAAQSNHAPSREQEDEWARHEYDPATLDRSWYFVYWPSKGWVWAYYDQKQGVWHGVDGKLRYNVMPLYIDGVESQPKGTLLNSSHPKKALDAMEAFILDKHPKLVKHFTYGGGSDVAHIRYKDWYVTVYHDGSYNILDGKNDSIVDHLGNEFDAQVALEALLRIAGEPWRTPDPNKHPHLDMLLYGEDDPYDPHKLIHKALYANAWFCTIHPEEQWSDEKIQRDWAMKAGWASAMQDLVLTPRTWGEYYAFMDEWSVTPSGDRKSDTIIDAVIDEAVRGMVVEGPATGALLKCRDLRPHGWYWPDVMKLRDRVQKRLINTEISDALDVIEPAGLAGNPYEMLLGFYERDGERDEHLKQGWTASEYTLLLTTLKKLAKEWKPPEPKAMEPPHHDPIDLWNLRDGMIYWVCFPDSGGVFTRWQLKLTAGGTWNWHEVDGDTIRAGMPLRAYHIGSNKLAIQREASPIYIMGKAKPPARKSIKAIERDPAIPVNPEFYPHRWKKVPASALLPGETYIVKWPNALGYTKWKYVGGETWSTVGTLKVNTADMPETIYWEIKEEPKPSVREEQVLPTPAKDKPGSGMFTQEDVVPEPLPVPSSGVWMLGDPLPKGSGGWVCPPTPRADEPVQAVQGDTVHIDPALTSFSGADMRLKVNGKTMGCVQSISFNYTGGDSLRGRGPKYGGVIKCVVLSNSNPHQLCKQLDGAEVVLVAANEYGNVAEFIKGKIKILSYSFGVAVDDLVPEVQFVYEMEPSTEELRSGQVAFEAHANRATPSR